MSDDVRRDLIKAQAQELRSAADQFMVTVGDQTMRDVVSRTVVDVLDDIDNVTVTGWPPAQDEMWLGICVVLLDSAETALGKWQSLATRLGKEMLAQKR